MVHITQDEPVDGIAKEMSLDCGKMVASQMIPTTERLR